MIKETIILSLLCLILILSGCETDDPVSNVTVPTLGVTFVLADDGKAYQSNSLLFNGRFTVPVLEDAERKIVNYGIFHNLAVHDDPVEEISIKLHYITDIFDGAPHQDSIFLASAIGNEIAYIIDESDFTGFGITVELEESDETDWYSFNESTGTVLNANQDGSAFTIREVINQDSAVYIKADFNCKLFNEAGEELSLTSGDLTFKLH